MKTKTIVFFILGAVFILGIPSYEGFGATLIGIILAAVFIYLGLRSMKKQKPATDITPVSESIATTPKQIDEPYEFLHIKVAGVTFKNGRKSRQSILRAIKFRDGEFSDGVELELTRYEFEGQPAYGIYANGQQIGNVPAHMVDYISTNFERIVSFSNIEVYGGGRDEDGHQKSFGCEVVLKLKK